MPEELSPHEKIAATESRDEHGHFVHVDHPDSTPPPPPPPHLNPVTKFLHDETAIHHTNEDELIDVHVGNPLQKITKLLEEIKKQKAFTFDIKGSLGAAGILLVLGTFGIFGGTKALCSKGVQTKIGTIHQLTYAEEQSVSILNDIPILNMLFKKPTTNRTILLTPDNHSIHLVFKNMTTSPVFAGSTPSLFATGEFDACSETLTVDTPASLQPVE